MKTWVALSYDLTKPLSEIAPRLKVPNNMKLEVVLELADEDFEDLHKDSHWAQEITHMAQARVKPVLEAVRDKLAAMDEAGKKDRQSVITPKTIAKTLDDLIQHRMEAIKPLITQDVVKHGEDFRKAKKIVRKFRITSTVRISLYALTIVGTAAVIGGTKGGAAPVGVIVILRTTGKMAQTIAKLFLDAKQMGGIVQADLAVLQTIMIKDMEGANKKQKARQIATEVALEVASGITGLETPSLGNLKKHIKDHQEKIYELELSCHKLSEKINEAMDAQEKWQAKFKEAARTMPAQKVGEVSKKKDVAEKKLGKVIEAMHEIGLEMAKAKANNMKFEAAYAAMVKGTPECLHLIKEATDLTVDVGLAVGGAHSIIEGAADAFEAVASNLADAAAQHA
jgi:hypothetical protein